MQISVEDDQGSIEYYAYLRSIMEIDEMSYWIGNPSVEIINGNITLAKLKGTCFEKEPETFEKYIDEIQRVNVLPLDQSVKEEPENEPTLTNSSNEIDINRRCLILCGIPNSKTPVEVIETSSIERHRHLLLEIRVVKTTHLKYYAMVLLFKSSRGAIIFFNELFGREYNQVEIERIILREMLDVTLCFSELLKDGENNEMKLLRKVSGEIEMAKMSPQNIFMRTHDFNLSQRIFCAICQEESSTYIISILCGHYFDWECLQRWQENTCPLCRYHQQPPIIRFCELCNHCEGLWVCLVCGRRLCCGSKNDILAEDSHIYLHYKETNHSLSMELETKFIFDARIPAFLHQLFYKELMSDGSEKIMIEHKREQELEELKKNKISDKISEYENEVAEEMKKQRQYYEEAIGEQNRQHKIVVGIKKGRILELEGLLKSAEEEGQTLTVEREKLNEEIIEFERQEKILSKLKKFCFEKVEQHNHSITASKHQNKEQLKELDEEISLKREELRNYKKNLELSDKLKTKLKNEQVVSGMFLVEQVKAKKR